MSLQEAIERKLHHAFTPAHMEVHNESHMHNVPEGSESHFKVLLVADAFEGQNRVARQRAVNRTLAEEVRGGIHALSLHVLTPAEWSARGGEDLQSPACRGGMGK